MLTIFRLVPKGMEDMMKHLSHLRYHQMPDYSLIMDILKVIYKKNSFLCVLIFAYMQTEKYYRPIMFVRIAVSTYSFFSTTEPI